MDGWFEKAKLLEREGRDGEAERAYRRALDEDPRSFRALNNLGVLLEQRGRLDEAADCYRKALEIEPGSAWLHYNLAHVLHRQDRLLEAQREYRRALDADPEMASAWFNLANVLYRQGRLDSAESAYEHVLAIVPGLPAALDRLGDVLFDLGRFEEAQARYEQAAEIEPASAAAHFKLAKTLDVRGQPERALECFRRSLELNPASRDACAHLARVLNGMGRTDEAADVLRGWLGEHPDDPVAAHMLSACTGLDVAARASDRYVRETFDAFARDFEWTVHRLGYQAPQLVAHALVELLGGRAEGLAIVDAGCGTGLCGPLLRSLAGRLTGVDLSERMLDVARAKGVYDELAAEELTSFLGRHAETFDAVVAADTLPYFGDLEPVASAVARSLRPNGAFVFTVEAGDEPVGGPGYRLEPHGRYRHGEAYVTAVLGGAGLRVVAVRRVVLRRESGRAVEGLLVVAVRAG